MVEVNLHRIAHCIVLKLVHMQTQQSEHLLPFCNRIAVPFVRIDGLRLKW